MSFLSLPGLPTFTMLYTLFLRSKQRLFLVGFIFLLFSYPILSFILLTIYPLLLLSFFSNLPACCLDCDDCMTQGCNLCHFHALQLLLAPRLLFQSTIKAVEAGWLT